MSKAEEIIEASKKIMKRKYLEKAREALRKKR